MLDGARMVPPFQGLTTYPIQIGWTFCGSFAPGRLWRESLFRVAIIHDRTGRPQIRAQKRSKKPKKVCCQGRKRKGHLKR